MTNVRGNLMYGNRIKSETLLARAIHLLTLGAHAWDDDSSNNTVSGGSNWRNLGGGDTGSVFHYLEAQSAPNAGDWVAMALLREPSDIMDCEWYCGKANTLALLKKIGHEGGNHCAFLSGIDPALRSGASWLCDFAAKVNPIVAAGLDIGSTNRERTTKEQEHQKRKTAAKEKAMAAMKAQVRSR